MGEVTDRPSARILLVDGRDRVLLYQGRGLAPDGRGHAWFTPGGGVRPGEDLREAAARELREETGHVVDPAALGEVVAVSSGLWTSGDGRVYRATDSFFLLRVPELEVDVSAMEDLEAGLIESFRWWSIPDLSATGELVYPLGLHSLLERLLYGGAPATPVTIPWHLP
ncbi:NUDIX hydrolase [Bailinhaonella thermotolerans]|uniref:NUDIX domain-containing protein n=1 Tax=Bailinhaonella thermotolerans TaxID=1070861 RepID=A0A3A4A559_9ACTN|nr:NUDIX domain-containing protein [Bailinhaonella thermotolerans]RJL22080.1 NUDIX domain-containing protein [Bailinhaonella thermotolerans]